MYTGIIPPEAEALDIIEPAHRYGMERLFKLCLETITANLNDNDLSDMCLLLKPFSATNLEAAAFIFDSQERLRLCEEETLREYSQYTSQYTTDQ